MTRSKGDRDRASWLRAYGKCRHIGAWTAVKIRWSLNVDKREKTALTKTAAGCPNVTLTVTKATVH